MTIKNKSIESLLENKRLLKENGEDSSKWSANWNTFKEAYKSEAPVSPWVFLNWNTNETGTSTLETFKGQCIALGNERVSGKEDSVFIQVEKHCTTTTDTGNA